MARYPEPPGGSMPDPTAPAPDGREIELEPIAVAACEAYARESPEYVERYGPAALPWCVHDNQHILQWAITLHSQPAFEKEIAWLARVLEARDFPLENLARGIELLARSFAAAEPELPEITDRIDRGVALLRSRESFLA